MYILYVQRMESIRACIESIREVHFRVTLEIRVHTQKLVGTRRVRILKVHFSKILTPQCAHFVPRYFLLKVSWNLAKMCRCKVHTKIGVFGG